MVVFAPSNGTRILQAVWKVAYDDGDSEQLNRVELVAAFRTYRLHAQEDPRKHRSFELYDETTHEEGEAQVNDTENSKEPMWGTGTDFLDP